MSRTTFISIFSILLFILIAKPISAREDISDISSSVSAFNNIICIIFNCNGNSPADSNTPSPNNTGNTNPQPTSSPQDRTLPSTDPLLPSELPNTEEAQRNLEEAKAQVGKCILNSDIYVQAATVTGIQWEVLAALHYMEGGCNRNQSLTSGRTIGSNEPDVVRNHGCQADTGQIGEPVPLPEGGCKFKNILDSAVYAGEHLKRTIGKTPSTFEELVKAFGRYNGTGNANCGKNVPYNKCPPQSEGFDHPYPMNKFYEPLYLIYCADFTQCNPPRIYPRPGAMLIYRALKEVTAQNNN